MAVAVVTRPQAPQVSGVHAQTAQDALLDALLSSCEKPTNPPLKSFGRDLKPYFAVADSISTAYIKEMNASHHKGQRNKPTPPPVAAAAAAAAASTKATPQSLKTSAKAVHSTKKLQAGRGKLASNKNENAAAMAPAAEKLPALMGGDIAALLPWAGPGFCVAPSPDKVPLPTSLLLE